MAGPYGCLVGMQSAVVRGWMKAVFTAADWYAVVLDPRPDLGIPARRMRGGYNWWW
jgi:hypothetical protein